MCALATSSFAVIAGTVLAVVLFGSLVVIALFGSPFGGDDE